MTPSPPLSETPCSSHCSITGANPSMLWVQPPEQPQFLSEGRKTRPVLARSHAGVANPAGASFDPKTTPHGGRVRSLPRCWLSQVGFLEEVKFLPCICLGFPVPVVVQAPFVCWINLSEAPHNAARAKGWRNSRHHCPRCAEDEDARGGIVPPGVGAACPRPMESWGWFWH